MKKACLAFVILCILNMASCNFGTVELPPLPTLAVDADTTGIPTLNAIEVTEVTGEPEPTPTLQPTIEPAAEPTATPGLSVTSKPTAVLAPMATPRSTATPEPTATSTTKPTAPSKPTSTPVPTVTLKPTATPKPTATLKPTISSKPVTSEINQLLKQGKVYTNTVIRGEVCTGEAEANEFFREKALTYSSFAVIVEKVEYLHSAKEYMAMYPEIEQMTIEKIDRYDNGFCAVFQDVETVYDANLCYAIRTGNHKVLSGTEREIYAYLNEVLNQTGAKQLTAVEAVKALHDYLVLELKYDENYREMSHSPEGVMRNRIAVCDGYARTMRLLLFMTGIESKVIRGTADNQPHAWNLVKIDGDWYHVDVTWDDPVPDVEGKVRYLCFLKNDVDMAKTHTWKSEIACTENEYQIYVYRDVLCDSEESLRSVYQSQIGTKEYLIFCYPKKGKLDEEKILDFLMTELQMGLSYYPEKELEDYIVLEVVNPLWEP